MPAIHQPAQAIAMRLLKSHLCGIALIGIRFALGVGHRLSDEEPYSVIDGEIGFPLGVGGGCVGRYQRVPREAQSLAKVRIAVKHLPDRERRRGCASHVTDEMNDRADAADADVQSLQRPGADRIEVFLDDCANRGGAHQVIPQLGPITSELVGND